MVLGSTSRTDTPPLVVSDFQRARQHVILVCALFMHRVAGLFEVADAGLEARFLLRRQHRIFLAAQRVELVEQALRGRLLK